ncbi:MAG: aliphatic sulfonate ABC transporter substrate-binding protein [Spirochaetaceae bacterium]|nr:MAG: aliphatic sulfonate ABC transporter substrate-binding protein [Spirochaetaceae bacterium]
MKKSIISKLLFASIALGILMCTAALASCSNQSRQLTQLNVSYVTAPFNLPTIIMKNKGILEDSLAQENIEVHWHEIVSGAQQAEAMAAGSLDIGGVMNTSSIFMARAAGNDVRIISGFSQPTQMFCIVSSDSTIQSIADLRGHSIAGPKGTVLHQLLLAALASENMTIDDVEFIHMGLAPASAAMAAGQIDAALLAGSMVMQAQNEGARIITSAQGLVVPKLVIAARGSFAEQHPDLVVAYREAHQQAQQWMEQNLEQALQIGADEQGISLEQARQLYDWTQFGSEISPADLESMQQDIDFMLSNDMLQQAIDPESSLLRL